MNTECTPNQLDFHGLGRRAVVAKPEFLPQTPLESRPSD